jgi:pimeloyl-ACP methyl ester carboxylesterase
MTLYTEVRGSGPPLLLIPGGNGDAATFGALQPYLVDRFTVIAYDRHGYSRSEPGAEHSLSGDVEDALQLLERFDRPATVLGSSSGAIVGLHLLVAHPELVGRLIAHEPPLLALLPDAEIQLAALDDVYATYLQAGAEVAMKRFAEVTGVPGAPQLPDPETLPPHVRELLRRMQPNTSYFLEHELRQYVRLVPDLDALASRTDRLELAGGRDSRGQLPSRATEVLAERLGVPVTEFPGAHVGYVSDPEAFAATLG